MTSDLRIRKVLQLVSHFAVFFLLFGFLLTCCMLLFVTTMVRTMDLTLASEHIQLAAKLTFVNVVFLSLVCTLIDRIRREITVNRKVKRITDAAQKMMQGDFSVRIPLDDKGDNDDGFNQIMDCFNKMAQELSGTETLRTDFIANVSHELKTPLAVMQNYGTLLQQPGLSEEQRLDYAKSITDASRRLANLITNILKLNKLENQRIFPVVEEFDLGEQVCECLLGFEDVWERKELNIETDIEDGVTIRSDSELLSLVWNNLFSNAMKFTPEGGTVSVSVKSEGERIAVKVEDTGCGISPEAGARIFDKFYQGDTSHATQGNGLGLALVKRIVDITGSDIVVESEVGKGTAFTVLMWRDHRGEA